jgi:RNA polymerase sigma-70 factor (ECF subfamily)
MTKSETSHNTKPPKPLARDAFEKLYRLNQDDVRLQVRRIVRDDASAEDVAQEVFLRVWERANQWRDEGTFRSWLMRIATNESLSYLRKKQRRREERLGQTLQEQSVPQSLVAAGAAPDVLLEREQERQLVRQIVADLPEDKREAIRLVYGAEVDLRQAAEQLGIPEGTVKSRLYYGRQQVARAWNNLENTEE